MSRPNSTAKPNRMGWIVFLLISVGAVLYFYTGGNDSGTPNKVAGKTAAKKSTVSGDSEILPIDTSIRFAALKAAPKDAFQPLVSKATLGTGTNEDQNSNFLPTVLTGGEDNWQFTGTVDVNGGKQALIENAKTSLSVFLVVGDKWKHAKLKRISDSDVVLTSDNGKDFDVKVAEAPAASKEAPAPVPDQQNPAANGNAPAAVTPAVTGQIGLDVTPLPGVGGGGWRGRRGGRGGRGGGYGGGGGGFGGG